MTVEKTLEETLREGFKCYREQYAEFIVATILFAVAMILTAIFWIPVITLPPLLFGLYRMSIKASNGDKVKTTDIFKGFDHLSTSLILCFLMYATIVIGFLFMIIPGLLFMVLFQYAVPLALLGGLGPIEALKKSNELAWKNIAYSIMLWLVLTVIESLGVLIVLGWLIVYPYTVICTSIAAKKLIM